MMCGMSVVEDGAGANGRREDPGDVTCIGRSGRTGHGKRPILENGTEKDQDLCGISG